MNFQIKVDKDFLMLQMKMIINEREKFLTFKLEKEEMKPEDMNEFLLKMNQDLKAQLQEVEDELWRMKLEESKEKMKEVIVKRYQFLKC
jgi:hypothetical protein